MRPVRKDGLGTLCWSCALQHRGTSRLSSNRSDVLVRRTFADGDTLGTSPRQQQRRNIASTTRNARLRRPDSSPPIHTRSYRESAKKDQATATASYKPHYNAFLDPAVSKKGPPSKFKKPSKIRQTLRVWNETHGATEHRDDFDFENDSNRESGMNSFSRLGDAEDLGTTEEMAEFDREELTHMTHSNIEDLGDLDPQHRFLQKGDLAELEFPRSEKDSTVAVFVRRIGTTNSMCQFFTVQGKWVHAMERQVMLNVPNHIDAKLIDRIEPYMPDQEPDQEMLNRAQFFDLSVPREVSAPIVSQLLKFQRESEELYRKHARRLDNAHELLADGQDLRFGSMDKVTRLLLKYDADEFLPPTALFTVRKALGHAGYAFGADRRSHRLTGFIQIRSKQQVAMVERVRQWIREWQDALAAASASPGSPPKYSRNAQYVVDYIEKAKRLITHSRTMRDATSLGILGPSKKRFSFKDGPSGQTTSNSNGRKGIIEYEFTENWTEHDVQIIKFMENWACSNGFLGLPRIESLPPLLMQATGMYEKASLTQGFGYMFLQETGVIWPFENKVRFDQHLLLPAAQHSKPLEQLLSKTVTMRDDHDLVDSMKDLRHDWGDLPVFCIDGQGAQEIDDGISVEPAENGAHWLHIHIANPTAFFDREHPLAKMARHMAETVYMPDRNFSMLPRWVSNEHFSLAPDRPCLTFSAKLGSSGDYLEHKITPGRVRNVILISPEQVSKVLGGNTDPHPDVILQVGGELPTFRTHWRDRQAQAQDLSESQVTMLKTMHQLAQKRSGYRQSEGGSYINSHRPDIQVWQYDNKPGLKVDGPSRVMARFCIGDPIIRYKNKELVSWMSSSESAGSVLVREMMLLACEIGGRWCAERQVPIIFRGSTNHQPMKISAEEYNRQVLIPAVERNGGETPIHLAFEYLRHTGSTALTTQPLRHKVLGLDHYTKATSPLRRYGDMILHWQIEAALRAEADGRKLFGRDNSKIVPFSVDNLKKIMTGMQPRESMIRNSMRYAEDTWTAMLMFRAFHYGECELPNTVQAHLVYEPSKSKAEIMVMIREFGFQAVMSPPEQFGLPEAKIGDAWEVTWHEIDVYMRKIAVRPLRLVSRFE